MGIEWGEEAEVGEGGELMVVCAGEWVCAGVGCLVSVVEGGEEVAKVVWLGEGEGCELKDLGGVGSLSGCLSNKGCEWVRDWIWLCCSPWLSRSCFRGRGGRRAEPGDLRGSLGGGIGVRGAALKEGRRICLGGGCDARGCKGEKWGGGETSMGEINGMARGLERGGSRIRIGPGILDAQPRGGIYRTGGWCM